MHTFVRTLSRSTAQVTHTAIASIVKLNSRPWRVQVRRKGRYASRTFRLRSDAQAWAREMEHRIYLGQSLNVRCAARAKTIGDLISLHVADMCEVGRAPLRSKTCNLEKLNLHAVRSRGGIAIVVAHRKSALAGVDLVLTMAKGKALAFGPKSEVLPKILRTVPQERPNKQSLGERLAEAGANTP